MPQTIQKEIMEKRILLITMEVIYLYYVLCVQKYSIKFSTEIIPEINA